MTPRSPNTETASTADQLRPFVGSYEADGDHRVWHIRLKGSRLHAEFLGRSLELRQARPGTFEPLDYFTNTVLTFEADGEARKLTVVQDTRTKTMHAVRVTTPSPEALRAYAGEYWSDELRATYRFVVKEGALWLIDLIGSDDIRRAGSVPLGELRPLSPDAFDVQSATLTFRFTRDPRGSVDGFSLNGFGERAIGFVRRVITAR